MDVGPECAGMLAHLMLAQVLDLDAGAGAQ